MLNRLPCTKRGWGEEQDGREAEKGYEDQLARRATAHCLTGSVLVGGPNLLYWRSTKLRISASVLPSWVSLIASRAISTQMLQPRAW
jgi:hypothetical protein